VEDQSVESVKQALEENTEALNGPVVAKFREAAQLVKDAPRFAIADFEEALALAQFDAPWATLAVINHRAKLPRVWSLLRDIASELGWREQRRLMERYLARDEAERVVARMMGR
jgi:hypothetical protein